jgi:hypothetical protein
MVDRGIVVPVAVERPVDGVRQRLDLRSCLDVRDVDRALRLRRGGIVTENERSWLRAEVS